jgi:dTDP-3-amino-3,4,6-trideoxy-alpha-D-glucose transaminase
VVPVVDLTRRLAAAQPEFQAAVARVLASGQVLLGPETEAFEAEFAAWAGARHAIAVSSGASAIQLALAASGVGAGHEVIVPAFTAVPTAAAVCAVGAVPVYADVEPLTATLDPVAAANVVTERTAAAMPVHLYGRPAASLELGDLTVIEDAAQAHGAIPGPRPSAAVIYSFYPTKNLGGIGDGGAICTDDDEVAARIRRLRVHGMTELYRHVEISQNFRMSELEAAWLRMQLPLLQQATERRRQIAAHYREQAPQLEWQLPHPDHVYHLCVFRAADRDASRAALTDRGVGTAAHYPAALPEQPAYRHFARQPGPVAADWAARCVSVPCFPEMTDAEVDLVGTALAALAAGESYRRPPPSK